MSVMIDVSHVVEHGMVTYEGLPAPVVSDYLSREASRGRYEGGTEFHIGKIEMVANTGTYLDAPSHRYADGADVSELPLSSLAHLGGVTVRVDDVGGRAINAAPFEGHELEGKAVLVHTGWSRHWRTDRYFEGHPYLTAEAAARLVEARAALVGIDSYNIDDTGDGTRPAHSLLLRAGIPVVEHLCNLESLPESGYRFYAVPVKVRGLGTFPVRAFAVLDAGAGGG